MSDEVYEDIGEDDIIKVVVENDIKEESTIINRIEEIKEEEATVAKNNDVKLGKLVSRLNHPVYISYGGQGMVIPPRGKMLGINKELLGALPKGVQYIGE